MSTYLVYLRVVIRKCKEMKVPILLLFTPIFTSLVSCASSQPSISVACEENNKGNFVMKWETSPIIEGRIKVYASPDPNHISTESNPVAEAGINEERVTLVSANPLVRMYYTMVFNDEFPVTLSSRNVNVSGVQNFRDIGGYPASRNKETVWGHVYRSADIDNIDSEGIAVLRGLGIRTIIDLRSQSEIRNSPRLKGINYIHIPIYSDDMLNEVSKVYNGDVIADSVPSLVERINAKVLSKRKWAYRKVFKCLLVRDNYPVLIECSDGKSRTGLVTAILLSALGVNYDFILKDYQLSNLYFDVTKFHRDAYRMPESAQEAITSFFSAKEDYLDDAYQHIIDDYGDATHYLTKGVGLSKHDIEKLRRLLLKNNY